MAAKKTLNLRQKRTQPEPNQDKMKTNLYNFTKYVEFKVYTEKCQDMDLIQPNKTTKREEFRLF